MTIRIFNHNKLFHDILANFFLEYLPFKYCIKIFVMYLNEGIEICYRFIYSILRLNEDELLKSTNSN